MAKLTFFRSIQDRTTPSPLKSRRCSGSLLLRSERIGGINLVTRLYNFRCLGKTYSSNLSNVNRVAMLERG